MSCDVARSVAQRLKDQAAWLQAKSPNLSLPGELQGMPDAQTGWRLGEGGEDGEGRRFPILRPTEEEAAEEHAELAQLHERWEKEQRRVPSPFVCICPPVFF